MTENEQQLPETPAVETHVLDLQEIGPEADVTMNCLSLASEVEH